MPGKNTPRPTDSNERWDLDEIRSLIDLLVEREIVEFEIEQGGLRLRIKRGEPVPPAAPTVLAVPSGLTVAPAPAGVPAASTGAGDAPAEAAAPPAPAVEIEKELFYVKSPIVGTFYASPAPTAPPFVQPGDLVKVGQVLCIVEAMKLMNEIESEVAGEIAQALVENGQPVEYGQKLFAILPASNP